MLAIILLSVFLAGAYNFLLFTFNTEISQRRGYMSSAIAEAHTFFTTRQALLESISLSATRQPEGEFVSVSAEEIHLLVGPSPKQQWSLWLTQRLRDYLTAKQVNLVYVSTEANAKVSRLYSATPAVNTFSETILRQLEALKHNDSKQIDELWLTEKDSPHARLYIFIRLDERERQSGWLGLEMDASEVSEALSDQSAGEFMMLNAQGSLLFSNKLMPELDERLLPLRDRNFFGLVV